jgi:iron-sulfur cluster assembly protein
MRYDSNGVAVWVNGKDHPYVNGLTMDYRRHGLNEGFEFINPNEKDRCGCGESFRV